ncbi:unnamed protein product [Dicrocoelium dendriticum]|nr:unnamed protein product [Dicrocoelium dendriticum]
MDIRRKTTYLSRSAEGRHSCNYSSFFQSAHKKYCNVDPASAMHMVGPMFELTACVELKGDEEDFDAVYPESALTYGPTICSFGLKYNDHNYALPSGLTPPSMAPHLMDLQHPRDKTTGDHRLDAPYLRAVFSEEFPRSRRPMERSEGYLGTESAHEHSVSDGPEPCMSSGATGDSENGLESRPRLLNPWLSSGRPASEYGPEAYSQDISAMSKYNRLSGTFEKIEMRYEPELKVIEVPEELAVSPSQLSDLDSDVSDDGYSALKSATDQTSRAPVIDGCLVNSSIWLNVRCTCGQTHTTAKLIRCPACNSHQHVDCMESHYNVSLPNLCEGYICPQCTSEKSAATSISQAEPHNLVTPTISVASNQTEAPSDSAPEQIQDTDLQGCGLLQSTQNTAGDVSRRLATKEGTVGAQYVEITADRAKRLGLLPNLLRADSSTAPHNKFGDRHNFKDSDSRTCHLGVDWERLTELSRSTRRAHGDTNVNLRVPSPPRTSKRKQDLTSTSYNDTDVGVIDPNAADKRMCPSSSIVPLYSDDSSSASVTPMTTPSSTPCKFQSPGTPSTPGFTLTPDSEYGSSSGLDSPARYHRHDKRRHKPGRVLFADNLSPGKRGFAVRANPLGAAWAKDYQEADCNAYSRALLDYVERRLSSHVERNYRIPPNCLTRSSLCRVVLFDHDDKGLEAAIRLSANEVVTEVRGKFLLLEEYEHYIDPISEYNRYVMFYRGFGDRAIIVDSSQYGNHARFVRRSCIPNCRLEHCFVQGKLQLVIRTSMEVMTGTELTIPFDLDYRACRYPLDCACARSRCPVLKWRRKLVRNKVVPNLDYSKYIESQLRVLSKPLTQESPGNRTSYDHPGLTSSPMIRSSAYSTLHPSPSVSNRQFDGMSDSFESSIDSEQPSELLFTTPSKATSASPFTSNQITNDSEVPLTSTAASPNTRQMASDISAHPIGLQPCAIEEKLTFQPIITTRRQAAAMRPTLH